MGATMKEGGIVGEDRKLLLEPVVRIG